MTVYVWTCAIGWEDRLKTSQCLVLSSQGYGFSSGHVWM